MSPGRRLPLTEVPTIPAVSLGSIGGIAIRSTKDLINQDTKICMLVYAHAKRGKTTFGASLDALTKKHFGKPTLFIALEPTEGGGTMSIQDHNVQYVAPSSMEELNKIIAGLAGDTQFGGVVLDSATEYVNRFLKPYALKFPYLKGTASPTRNAGVPEQGDYQTMGEQLRIDFNKLIGLTTHPDPRVRKHLLITALEREKLSRDGKELLAVQPDLPGAMASVATSMFQTVGCIELKTVVESIGGKPTRVTRRRLLTESTEENKRVIGDRTKLIPDGAPMDLVEIYEQFWLPKLKSRAA